MVIGLLNSLLVTAISIFRTQDDLIVLSIAIFFHVRTINKICAFFKTYLICIHAGTVTNEESLFAVSNRTKRQSGSDPSIIPILFEDLNFTDTQTYTNVNLPIDTSRTNKANKKGNTQVKHTL